MREIASIFIFVLVTVLFLYTKYSNENTKKEEAPRAFCGNASLSSNSQKSPLLFKAKCESCHLPYKNATGPNMEYLDLRQPYEGWFHDFVTNQDSLIEIKDFYTLSVMEYSPVEFIHNYIELDSSEVETLYKFVIRRD